MRFIGHFVGVLQIMMYSLIAILCMINKIPEHLTSVELFRIGTELYIDILYVLLIWKII